MKAKQILKTGFRWACWCFLGVVLLVVARAVYVFRDRVPGYALDLSIKPAANPAPLRVGFARVNINPDLDYPKRPVWVAGFSQNRAATAIHDDLWAVACVMDDGQTRVGIVALDAIGFFHDDVVAVRRGCSAAWDLDYVVVCATHNHSTPDLMGLWGPSPFRTGVDPIYRKRVIQAAIESLGAAVAGLAPARLAAHHTAVPVEGLVADSRQPLVYDSDLRVLHFTSPQNGTTLGTIVGWGNHPETPWSRNTEITSDFCGYLRDALQAGVRSDEKVLARGVGGIHLFINGAVGGLMTTSPGVTVRDPFLQTDHKEPSHGKARALGHQLAARVLPLLEQTNASPTSPLALGVEARTLLVPVENLGYLAASYLGLMDRGYARWRQIRTEVALLTLGEVSFACVPGEIYPEIVNGGVEAPVGGDFQIDPLEIPPLRQLMPGQVKFVFGLANDEIGYLVPKSQWDVQPPFTYGREKRPYGEVNSCGPEAAVLVHRHLSELCKRATAPRNVAVDPGV